MEKNENPYLGMAEMMGKTAGENGPKSGGCMTGTVKSATPLVISCAGMDIDGEALYINAELMKDYEREITLKMPAYAVNGTVQANANTIAKNEAITEKMGLSEGDMVLIVPSTDMQAYYVICKVVAANG